MVWCGIATNDKERRPQTRVHVHEFFFTSSLVGEGSVHQQLLLFQCSEEEIFISVSIPAYAQSCLLEK